MRCYLQSSGSSIELCSHCAYSLGMPSFALFATHGSFQEFTKCGYCCGYFDVLTAGNSVNRGCSRAARFHVAFELIWLSHYLPRTAQRLVRLPYSIQVPYGLDGFAETFDWIKKNTDKSAVLATAYDPT